MDAWASMITTWPKPFPSARDWEAAELCRGVTRLGCPSGTLLPDKPDPMRSLRVAAEMGTWSPFVIPSAWGPSMLARRETMRCACWCFWILKMTEQISVQT